MKTRTKSRQNNRRSLLIARVSSPVSGRRWHPTTCRLTCSLFRTSCTRCLAICLYRYGWLTFLICQTVGRSGTWLDQQLKLIYARPVNESFKRTSASSVLCTSSCWMTVSLGCGVSASSVITTPSQTPLTASSFKTSMESRGVVGSYLPSCGATWVE